MKEWSREELARRVVSSFHFAVQLHKTWGLYLLHPEFDYEPELRNRLFAIHLIGLIDAAKDIENRQSLILQHANLLGNLTAFHYMSYSKAFCDGIVDIVSDYSDEELVFLVEMRNQFVHGALNGHNDSQTLSSYRVINNSIKTDKVSNSEYHRIFRKVLFCYNNNVDAALSDMRRRFCNSKKLFWTMISIARNYKVDLIQKEIINSPLERGTHVQFYLLNDSYFDTAKLHEWHSLADIRSYNKFENTKLKDTVFG